MSHRVVPLGIQWVYLGMPPGTQMIKRFNGSSDFFYTCFTTKWTLRNGNLDISVLDLRV